MPNAAARDSKGVPFPPPDNIVFKRRAAYFTETSSMQPRMDFATLSDSTNARTHTHGMGGWMDGWLDGCQPLLILLQLVTQTCTAYPPHPLLKFRNAIAT